MKSIKEIYRIGKGPSSSHTMGPRKAAEIFSERYPGAASYKVVLYGSLAATGKGHLTDKALRDEAECNNVEINIIWRPEVFKPFHPNALTFSSQDNEICAT